MHNLEKNQKSSLVQSQNYIYVYTVVLTGDARESSVIYALVIFIHSSPTYGNSRGIAGLRTKGAGQLLSDCPCSAGELPWFNIGTFFTLIFSVV